METLGYPSFVLYLILLLGIPMALKKPFEAYLMVVFLLSSADAQAFTYTRTALLGPYLNANDACLLIALTAMFSYISHDINKMQFPNVTKWIIAVLLIGFVQSWFVLGWKYEVLRAMRWAINLPIYFIIAATVVDRKEKVRPLLVALLAGSVISAFEHLIFVRARIDIYGSSLQHFRSIAFRNPGIFFVLASLIWIPKIKDRDKIIVISSCILFVISMLLNQTRSIWLSTVAALPVGLLFFRPKDIHIKVFIWPIVLLGLFIGVFVITELFMPEIDVDDMILGRFESLSEHPSVIARLISLESEMEEWGNSTLVFGQGLFYFAKYRVSHHIIAWGHLGHITTMAQLGIIGLIVYSFYLPITIIKASKRLWKQTSDEVRFLGLLAGIAVIWYWICFTMSDSYLGQHAIAGLIFGTAWRQAMLIKTPWTKVKG
jgi:hypothetical protein